MIGLADPELLLSRWLADATGHKVWRDPVLPADWNWTTPLGHLQRGQDGFGDQLTLESVLLDLSWYASKADTARAAANKAHVALMRDLPLTNLPGPIFVKSVQVVSPPNWLPDPTIFRRGTSYRVWLHGWVDA